jgi:GNAT superfamily N-acetyltransferase
VTSTEIVKINDVEEIAQCEVLFREYVTWNTNELFVGSGIKLTEADIERAHDEFRAEWGNLVGPRGRLYLAIVDGNPAGVGALKPVSAEVGEVKRMFVRPAARRAGAARAILTQLIADAGEIGYRTLRLETMTYMVEAQGLYRSLGFVDSEAFAAEGSTFGVDQCELFMELKIR